MSWVDRLRELTDWHQERLELNWEGLESELGTRLPGDYKELCAQFEPGSFSASLSLLRGGDHHLYDLRSTWVLQKSLFEQDPSGADRLFAPYTSYGARKNQGLIQWGRAEMVECDYFWMADEAVDSAEWLVIARQDSAADWHTYPMSTAEFIYHVIADQEFHPFGVVNEMGAPFYLSFTEIPNCDPAL